MHDVHGSDERGEHAEARFSSLAQAVGAKQSGDAIYAFVDANPGATSREVRAALGASAAAGLSTMAHRGRLVRRRGEDNLWRYWLNSLQCDDDDEVTPIAPESELRIVSEESHAAVLKRSVRALESAAGLLAMAVRIEGSVSEDTADAVLRLIASAHSSASLVQEQLAAEVS